MANETFIKFRSSFDQAEFFIDAVSGYESDFALFPEFFIAPLMADYNHLSEADAIRELAKYANLFVENFRNLPFLTILILLQEVCPT